MRRSTTRERDTGFVIVMFALLLITLLIFAAFAIDLGAVYNHRRQDQNAADSGALAAAQELGGPEADLVAEAKTYAEDTLEVDIPDGPDGWNSCTGDPGALTTQATGSNCISYTDREVRVRIPDQTYNTFFARFGGSDTFTHAAFAIAGMRPEGLAGVLPYAVTGVSADGGFGCMQTNSNGQASGWCGTTSGNFGFMDFSQYGNSLLGTSQSCGSGATHERMRDNTAMGADHDLSRENEVYNFPVIDAPDACQSGTPSPNAANTQTGNWSTDITEGLFYRDDVFSDGQPSRLRRVDDNLLNGTGQERTVFGRTDLDDNPLWRYIPASYGPAETTDADIPESCKRDQFVNPANNNYYATATNNPDLDDGVEAFVEASAGSNAPRDVVLGLLSRCFYHYLGQDWTGFPVGSLTPESPTGCDEDGDPACTDPVFALNTSDEDEPDLYDIQYTPRFAYVPQIEDFPPGGSGERVFLRFRPIFIQRLVIETPGDAEIFDPGVTPAPPTSGTYHRVGETSIFVFPETMLPGSLGSEDAPFELGVNRFIRLIR